MRRCEICGKSMLEGYVIDQGLEYYCSPKCLHTEISQDEYNELYRDGNAYWTEWEEEDEEGLD